MCYPCCRKHLPPSNASKEADEEKTTCRKITVASTKSDESPKTNPITSIGKIELVALNYIVNRPPRVLVVEDLPANMKIILFRLQKELTKLGIENPEIDAAVDGKEALRFAANYDYDLIITDWSVPPPDGIEITKTIRGETILSEHLARRNIDTAIIGWTTETNAEALQKFLDSGINDQLDKPLTGEGIQRIAMKYLPNFIRQNGN